MPKPPDEICSSCGKVITSRANAYVHDARILCTKCYNGLIDNGRPASERQLQYMSDLGLTPAAAMTMNDARKMISAAVDIKQYLYLLAKQVWPDSDLTGLDLRPIVISLYDNPEYRGEILAIYPRVVDEAFEAQAQLDKQNAGKSGYEQPYYGDFVAPIPKSGSSKVAVIGLAMMLGKITVDPSKPGECTVPASEQKALLSWLSA